MHNIILLFLFLGIGFLSCKTSEKDLTHPEIAKTYYQFLDTSDATGMLSLLGDTIVIRENEDDYEERFTQKEYLEWLKWDSVFEPSYNILEMEHQNGMVKAKISKIDKRIRFLHERPMVWNEIIQFEHNKIIRVERIAYDVFDVGTFVKNRDGLVNWIHKNHPELNGFIHDQTEAGAITYLRAIELFQNNNSVP